jgi:hypothetical protein
MDKLIVESVALLLLCAAFPLISLGATGGHAPVWWIGLLSLVVGGLLPIATRYLDHSKDKPTDVGMEFDERTS